MTSLPTANVCTRGSREPSGSCKSSGGRSGGALPRGPTLNRNMKCRWKAGLVSQVSSRGGGGAGSPQFNSKSHQTSAFLHTHTNTRAHIRLLQNTKKVCFTPPTLRAALQPSDLTANIGTSGSDTEQLHTHTLTQDLRCFTIHTHTVHIHTHKVA